MANQKMWAILLLTSILNTHRVHGFTDFIPCSQTCNGGDVNYDLVASVETMKMMNYTYRGRIFSSENGGIDEETAFMGPTMHVRPGQSMWIKFTNNLTTPNLGPHDPTVTDYWKMLQTPGEHIKYQYYKKPVADPSLMNVDKPNIPGHFDSTNLHVHGLDVEVHMFDPVGTHNPDAPHIRIDPGECYCYKFNVPDHHPPGMYWYHPHLHGSTAVQMWGGLFGLLYVDGPLEEELASYGVTQTQEFLIWDPAFKAVDEPTHNLEVDEFLMGQTTLSKIHPFLVNGKMEPSFETATGQVLHLRVLCGVVENEVTFIVYPEGRDEEPWDDAGIDFWVIGADGVTYRKPVKKRIIVMSGGGRNEILLKFDEPGTYVIRQQGIQGMQFFDMYGHPHVSTRRRRSCSCFVSLCGFYRSNTDLHCITDRIKLLPRFTSMTMTPLSCLLSPLMKWYLRLDTKRVNRSRPKIS
jgi:FtsP/CotA-like multicopper oxidase with cupredoxin domain